MTPSRLVSALAIALVGVACAARAPELEPRYVAVHDAFAAVGMAEIGPLRRGSLAERREARFDLAPPPGSECVTVAAFGAGGVRDLDLEILDADGKSIGRDATADSEAVVRACPDSAQVTRALTFVVRMTKGAGDFLAASWTGAAAPAIAGRSAPAGSDAAGTCDSPIPLLAGSITGNTRRGEADNSGGCGNSEAKELVYKLEVPRTARVVIEVEPTNFDSVVYIRRDDCGSKEAEVACNDDAASGTKHGVSTRGSRIDETLDPGTYWVFVDGYQSEAGAFRMNVRIEDVPTLIEACAHTKPLVQRATGTLTGAFNHAAGSCDRGHGPDALHRLVVPQRARVRVVLHSDEFSPVLHIRRTCTDERSEVGCTDTGVQPEEASFAGVLEPGTYTVFADSGDKSAHGQYSLDADLAPEQGIGVRGDACGDAIPIAIDEAAHADTFLARDDFASRCAAPGAPDVVYKFDVAHKSRVTVKLGQEEGDHTLTLLRNCTDPSSEIACGAVIDEILAPGTYAVVVDGSTKGPMGRFALQVRAKDVTAQETACRTAPAITVGQTVTGTTAGAPDRFTESCAGREESQQSGDKAYKLTLAARTHLQALLSTPNHDGVLAIRRTCADPPQMKSARVTEVACNNDGPDNRHSKLDVTLDPGVYFVVVDGHQGKHEGSFSLQLKSVN